MCCSLEFFSWTELCFVIIPSLFRLFLLSPRFFFLSVPDKNYCCAKRHHLLAVSAPTEADRRVLLSSANAEKRPLSCQGPYCVLKWFLHLLPASSPIFETHPFYCRTQLSGVSKISLTICTQRCNQMCEHNFSISKLWLLQHKLITLKLNERSLFCAPIKYGFLWIHL